MQWKEWIRNYNLYILRIDLRKIKNSLHISLTQLLYQTKIENIKACMFDRSVLKLAKTFAYNHRGQGTVIIRRVGCTKSSDVCQYNHVMQRFYANLNNLVIFFFLYSHTIQTIICSYVSSSTLFLWQFFINMLIRSFDRTCEYFPRQWIKKFAVFWFLLLKFSRHTHYAYVYNVQMYNKFQSYRYSVQLYTNICTYIYSLKGWCLTERVPQMNMLWIWMNIMAWMDFEVE